MCRRLLLVLLLPFSSLHAYAAVAHLEQPITWRVFALPGHFVGNLHLPHTDPLGSLSGSFTTLGDMIIDWNFVDSSRLRIMDLSPTRLCADGETGCSTAAFLSPTHILFHYNSSPASTQSLDLVLDAPLSEGVHFTADLFTQYGQQAFHGEGLLAVPEPTPLASLGIFLGSLVLARLLGRSRGSTGRSRPSSMTQAPAHLHPSGFDSH